MLKNYQLDGRTNGGPWKYVDQEYDPYIPLMGEALTLAYQTHTRV